LKFVATPIRWRYVWTGYIPVMHLSHTRYSADLQRRMTLEIVAPSLWCRRSVTKVVLRFKTARKVLKAATASKRLRFGALSLGRVLLQFSANSRVVGRIRNQKDPYFCGPGQISGPSACLPSSANSSALSLRRQPVWLLTFTRVNLPDHWRSSCKSGRMTAKCTISLGLGWKSLRPHFLRISRMTRQSTNISR
jgi:hypothetical protein